MKRGAEAVLEPGTTLGRSIVAKRRIAKGYRHPALDARLRAERTRDEANLLVAARATGVPVPVLYDIDRANDTLELEKIDGFTLREQLREDDKPLALRRLSELGRMTAVLHAAGLTHGDLTTSNVLVPDAASPRLVLLDFGLGAFTEEAEARGVDLHLVEEALAATESEANALFAAFLASYEAAAPKVAQTLRRLDDIRERGRYR